MRMFVTCILLCGLLTLSTSRDLLIAGSYDVLGECSVLSVDVKWEARARSSRECAAICDRDNNCAALHYNKTVQICKGLGACQDLAISNEIPDGRCMCKRKYHNNHVILYIYF